jgi:transglutaminase-like putative cysteine protease
MRLRIEHTTTFAYDTAVAEAYSELRLRPLEGDGQHCTTFRIATDPPGIRVHAYADHRGNDVRHFDLLEPHDRLAITARSEVATPGLFAGGRRPTELELYDYLAPTQYARFTPAVRELAEAHAGEGTAAERATRISSAIYERLTYEPGVTDVHTRSDEVLALGRGVCQDFAHLLIAACRSHGIAARYVSGYLFDPSLVGDAAASHAWVDVLDDERGWVSLDPTHDREQTDSYVRVAVGRDYAEVPPTRGVYKGGAHETLHVHVELRAA